MRRTTHFFAGRGHAGEIFPKLAIKRGSFAATFVALAKSLSRPRAKGMEDERGWRGERTPRVLPLGNAIPGIMVTGFSSTASLSSSLPLSLSLPPLSLSRGFARGANRISFEARASVESFAATLVKSFVVEKKKEARSSESFLFARFFSDAARTSLPLLDTLRLY